MIVKRGISLKQAIQWSGHHMVWLLGWAAVDSNVKGGEYYGPHKVMKGNPVLVSSNGVSHNKEVAQKLWNLSEKLTGMSFNFR